MKSLNPNPYLKFYTKHNISPVHQDIADLGLHLYRREKLYRTLGLPVVVFTNKEVLEVGSGGGHNALAFLKWGSKVDFVEPNPKAQEELKPFLDNYHIDKNAWKLHKCKIEDYNIEKKYGIVIAEGFIQCIPNKKEVIDKISSYVKNGGVVVVTCTDDISFFFDYLRRILAFRLIKLKGIVRFEEKVKILSKAFSSHLKSLKYASRPAEDWVIDNLVNPEEYGDFFSMADCVKIFGDEFEVLGSSPSIFTDYSWYKDYTYKAKRSILKQFYAKRHLLIMAGLDECSKDAGQNEKLYLKVKEFRKTIEGHEDNIDDDMVNKSIDLLDDIKILTSDIDSLIPEIIGEVIFLLKDKDLNSDKISNAGKFCKVFGRGQQYISMVKRFTNLAKAGNKNV